MSTFLDEKMTKATSHIELADGLTNSHDEYENQIVDDDDDFHFTEAEERKVVFKIDCYLLITIFWMYLLSYLDRTNIGNAKVGGMEEDLNLDSVKYSNALIVFFIFYVVFEVPASYLLIKFGPRIFIPSIMVIWGILSASFAAIHTYGQLVAIRALVGCFESGFAPGILLILSSWYKREEQSKRFAIYISAAILSGAFGGIIAGLITEYLHMANGIAGWRWLFIIEGAGTVFVALIAFFTLLPLPQHMTKSKGFTEREIRIAIVRLKRNKVENNDGHHVTALGAIVSNFKSLRVILLIIGYMVIVGSSTLSYFYPTLVGGLGYSGSMVQYMTIPIYGSAFVLNLIVAFFSDKFIHQRGFILAGLLFASGVFAIIVVTVYGFTTRYAMLCLMASALWSANALALSYTATTLADKDSKTRSVGLSIVNALGNLAQIYGSYLFPSKDSPKYLMGFGVITGMCFLGFFTYLALAIYYKTRIRKVALETEETSDY